MSKKTTEKLIEYLEGALSEEDRKKFCDQLAEDSDLRSREAGLKLVLKAEDLASSDDGEVASGFEDAVMRRVRVAPAPSKSSNSIRSFGLFIRSITDSPFRFSATLTASCIILTLCLTPYLRVRNPEPNYSNFRLMYDAQRDESFARVVNAVTARIPAGFRAISLEVSGAARPGEYVDVVWLSELQNKSVSAMIVQGVRVLSIEHDPSTAEEEIERSTVTLIIAAEDAAKVELARATGRLVLSVNDAIALPDSPVEEFLLRGGTLVPKA